MMADTSKISSLMADSLRGILPFMSEGMQPEDILDNIYSDIVNTMFLELEEMGIAGPLNKREDDKKTGSPVYEGDCLLSPNVLYPTRDEKFVIRLNGEMIRIVIEVPLVNNDVREIFFGDIGMFDDFDESIIDLSRRCCIGLIHTKESLEKMNRWFSSKTKLEDREEEVWRPKDGESYVYVSETLDVFVGEYSSSNPDDVERVASGNFFQDANDALAAIEKARRNEEK